MILAYKILIIFLLFVFNFCTKFFFYSLYGIADHVLCRFDYRKPNFMMADVWNFLLFYNRIKSRLQILQFPKVKRPQKWRHTSTFCDCGRLSRRIIPRFNYNSVNEFKNDTFKNLNRKNWRFVCKDEIHLNSLILYNNLFSLIFLSPTYLFTESVSLLC